MIVVRTFSTVGGVRSGRRSTRKLDRKARSLGYRNAQVWALALMERQLKRQSAQRVVGMDLADAELRVAALEAA